MRAKETVAEVVRQVAGGLGILKRLRSDDADDITQDVQLRILQRLHLESLSPTVPQNLTRLFSDADSRDEACRYVNTCLRHAVGALLRKRGQSRSTSRESDGLPANCSDATLEGLEIHEAQWIVDAVRAHIQPMGHGVFVLDLVLGKFSMREYAERNGICERTARRWFVAGAEQLRRAVDRALAERYGPTAVAAFRSAVTRLRPSSHQRDSEAPDVCAIPTDPLTALGNDLKDLRRRLGDKEFRRRLSELESSHTVAIIEVLLRGGGPGELLDMLAARFFDGSGQRAWQMALIAAKREFLVRLPHVRRFFQSAQDSTDSRS